MVIVGLFHSALTSIFPLKVIQKHQITLKMVATGNATVKDGVKCWGLTLVVCCTFHLFSQYNSRAVLYPGEFRLIIGLGYL
jgi:hypothetical protein